MYYYSKIGNTGAGFTNQIFALITSIINAYKEGKKVVLLDNFLNDISKTTYTPVSEIFNITDINVFLKKNYDIIILDKNNINFEIVSATYGSNETNYYINLTDYVTKQFNDNKLFISKNICFNDIKGDPCPLVFKKFILKYKINGYVIEETYDENLQNDIVIDFNGQYEFTFGWIDKSFNDNMFEKILTNIKYHDNFISNSELIIKEIDTSKKINIIHLRLENDGIEWWSRQNNTSQNDFKEYLEQKYINLIKNYLSQTDENIILSHSFSNGVVDFLKQNNYSYKFIDKFFNDREKDAIVDLLVSKYCNNIFIGNFNINNLNGSTFSYYIGKCVKENVTKIYIDLDRIHDQEVVIN